MQHKSATLKLPQPKQPSSSQSSYNQTERSYDVLSMICLTGRMERLSRYLSYILRHNPSSLGLMVDRQGYASLDSLISAIRSQEEWNWVSETDVMNLLVRPDKKRFEVTDGKIRATYGHSLSTKLRYEVIIPPKVLYHGTMRASLQSILKHGILPMSRQYVHLSASIEEASAVGKRRDRNPTIIRVLALEAHKKGVKFFHAGTLFLSEKIPPEFIEVLRE